MNFREDVSWNWLRVADFGITGVLMPED